MHAAFVAVERAATLMEDACRKVSTAMVNIPEPIKSQAKTELLAKVSLWANVLAISNATGIPDGSIRHLFNTQWPDEFECQKITGNQNVWRMKLHQGEPNSGETVADRDNPE